MDTDSGSDSDPTIERPGWNVTQMPNRGDKKKMAFEKEVKEQDHVSSEDDKPPPKRLPKAGRRKKAPNREIDSDQEAAGGRVASKKRKDRVEDAAKRTRKGRQSRAGTPDDM